MVNVINNVTLDVMELEFSGFAGNANRENFTTYTEEDVENKLTVIDYRVNWDNYEREDYSRVYYDYVTDDITDGFEYNFVFEITDLEGGDGTNRPFVMLLLVSKNIGAGLGSNEISAFLRNMGTSDTTYRAVLRIRDESVSTTDYSGVDLNVSTVYYGELNRTGINVNFNIYSDAGHGDLIESLYLNDGNDDYRYIIVAKSFFSGSDPTDWSDGYIENLWNVTKGIDLTGGYLDEGYFTTVNYLNSSITNGSILVQMTNATIPANTQITVEFSEDNSTWVNNVGVPGYNTLTDGFLSIDLRNLNYSIGYHQRYNLSTADNSITPRLYQSRLITTIGGGGDVVSGTSYPFLIPIIITVLLISTLGLFYIKGGRKRR